MNRRRNPVPSGIWSRAKPVVRQFLHTLHVTLLCGDFMNSKTKQSWAHKTASVRIASFFVVLETGSHYTVLVGLEFSIVSTRLA